MKILITGSHGQLGTELLRQLKEGRSEIGPIPEKLCTAKVIPTDADELDITDRDEVVAFVRRMEPDVIINCAAYTNVDGCETNRVCRNDRTDCGCCVCVCFCPCRCNLRF